MVPAARRAKPVGRRSRATASPVRTDSVSSRPRGPGSAGLPSGYHRSRWTWTPIPPRTPRSGTASPSSRSDGALDGAAADELIEHYQAGSTHLSVIRTTVGDSPQGDRLSLALWRARQRFTGTAANPLRQLTVLFVHQLPAALYRIRWLTLAVTLATVLIALVFAVWYSSDPRVLATLGPRSALERYAEQDFVELLLAVLRGRVRRAGLDQQRLDRGAVHHVRHHRRLGARTSCSATPWASASRRRS